MALQTFRDALILTVPRWLRGYWGSRLLFAIGIQLDAIMDGLAAALKLAMPGLYTYESLPLIGNDRRITRTFTETDAAYATRLQTWRQDNARRGNPFALMEQIQAHLLPQAVRVAVVNNQGHRLEIETDGTPSVIGATAWDWDGDADPWARCWVILYDTAWDSDGAWGDAGDWGDDPTATIGTTATIAEVTRVRQLVNEWGAAHARIVWVIVATDEAAWESVQPTGSVDWDNFDNRNHFAAYWHGTGT